MKKIAIISALVLGSVILLSKDKVKALFSEYEDTLNKLKIQLNDISDVDISNSTLTAKAILNITNPTLISIGANSGGYITLKKLEFYTASGEYIGVATPNITNIELPAQQTISTPRIPLSIPLNGNIIDLGIELMTNSKNLQVKGEVEAFGKIITF